MQVHDYMIQHVTNLILRIKTKEELVVNVGRVKVRSVLWFGKFAEILNFPGECLGFRYLG